MIQNHIGKQATPISLQEFADMPDPRVMKSHGTVDTFLGANGEGLAGLPEGVKVVLITRNPFDACVSSYYYGHNAHRQGWPFEAWAAMFLSGMLPQGDWFEWVRGWHAQVILSTLSNTVLMPEYLSRCGTMITCNSTMWYRFLFSSYSCKISTTGCR